jgi:hypothetical protein
MNPDLRAIETALRNEPCDHSNLSPEAASVVLPLVRRVVRERDDGQHEIDVIRRERLAERQRVDERDQDVIRLRAALEEARLTLAAEQGRAEGAPSEGWVYDRRYRQWNKPRGFHVMKIGTEWSWRVSPYPTGSSWWGREPTARAAMLAADKALFESRRARCLAKSRQLQSDGVILYPPNGTHQQTPTIMIDRLSDPDLTEAVLAIYEKVLFP